MDSAGPNHAASLSGRDTSGGRGREETKIAFKLDAPIPAPNAEGGGYAHQRLKGERDWGAHGSKGGVLVGERAEERGGRGRKSFEEGERGRGRASAHAIHVHSLH